MTDEEIYAVGAFISGCAFCGMIIATILLM